MYMGLKGSPQFLLDTVCQNLHSSADLRCSHSEHLVQVDARQVERKAQAAQQAMARRAQKLEKAQAAATQAHLAALERQSSQQKEQARLPAPASLQQVHHSSNAVAFRA